MRRALLSTLVVQAVLNIVNLLLVTVVFGIWGFSTGWNNTPGPGPSGAFLYLVIWLSMILQAHRHQFAYPISRQEWVTVRLAVTLGVIALALVSFLSGWFLGHRNTAQASGTLAPVWWSFFLFTCFVTGPYLWNIARFRRADTVDRAMVVATLFNLAGLFPWCDAGKVLSNLPLAWSLGAGTAGLALAAVFGTLTLRYLRTGEEKS